MNYLAHAYLSMGQSGIITGNMISDFVKGKKQYEFPTRIRKGIQLHRKIDAFTDQHPATTEIKKIFRPYYRLYAGAFADVVYDFFLANDKESFTGQAEIFALTKDTYNDLRENESHLPPAFIPVFKSMQTHDWLAHYGNEWAIKKSFENLVKKSKYLSESETAFSLFLENIPVIQQSYSSFFPEIKAFAKAGIEELLRED